MAIRVYRDVMGFLQHSAPSRPGDRACGMTGGTLPRPPAKSPGVGGGSRSGHGRIRGNAGGRLRVFSRFRARMPSDRCAAARVLRDMLSTSRLHHFIFIGCITSLMGRVEGPMPPVQHASRFGKGNPYDLQHASGSD
jgi:hypothetical protein